MALISLRGPLGAGKTAAAQEAVDRFGFVRVAWADEVRIEVYDILDLGFFRFPEGTPQEVKDSFSATLPAFPKNPSREDKIAFISKHKQGLRTLMQWWGTEYRRAQDPDYWVNHWKNQVKKLLQAGQHVVVDDTRFENELLTVKRLGGYDIEIIADEARIRENLKSRDGKVVKGLAGHASEEGLPYEPDYSVVNNGSLTTYLLNVGFVLNKVLSNPRPVRVRPKKRIL